MVWEYIIPGIAVGLSLISLFFRYIMHDREKMLDLEFAVIRKQREVKKYQKDKDTKAMMAAQKEMMALSMDKMKTGFRSTIITLPLFLLVWWVVLGPMLTVGPLTAGEVSQVGAELRNLDASQQQLDVSLVSSDIQTVGNSAENITLNALGSEGDRKTLWWNVTAAAGARDYSIVVNSLGSNSTDEVSYPVSFVSKDSLGADFSPQPAKEILGGGVDVTPIYHPHRINLFGFILDWNWYYFLSFFIMMPLMYPLTNRLLWGHVKGIKHLEKLDSKKSAERKGQKQSN